MLISVGAPVKNREAFKGKIGGGWRVELVFLVVWKHFDLFLHVGAQEFVPSLIASFITT